ncbi:MAG TPA: hypothetical protein VFM06_00060 [Candidatus Limnocylindria bacterium]|nr:hypothetical protein [Candidatus Limnocylindria bacterium]
MRTVALGLALVLAACSASARPIPSASPTAAASPTAVPAAEEEGQPPATPPPPVVDTRTAPIPLPQVTLVSNDFRVGAPPPLQRLAKSEFPSETLLPWAGFFLQQLDSFRGVGPGARAAGRNTPVLDEEWGQIVWPGPFQQIVRKAVAAKPAEGRFFHLESATLDAVYALPWSGIQLIDATIVFRDHAETPPAEGELWYTWRVRLPATGARLFAVADGYDGTMRSFPRIEPYWTRALLESEAVSTAAGYLWNESYVPGGHQQGWNGSVESAFAKDRVAALNELNRLFGAGTLTSRAFEDVRVRIDAFDPLTIFGGGIVTATVSGRLVEVVSGSTVSERFDQPMKFFRFGASGVGLSGWFPVDAYQDGRWLSGGELALDKLSTGHG